MIRHVRTTDQVVVDGLRVCGRCSVVAMKDILKSGSKSFAWVRLLLLLAVMGFAFLIITETSTTANLANLQRSPETLEQEEFHHVEPLMVNQPTKDSSNAELDATGVNSVEVLSNISRIFYNRVPKCGSRTILRVLEELTNKHKINNYHSDIYNSKQLTPDGEVQFVKDFIHHDAPLLHDRHLYFVDFTKQGHEMPMYINLLRDPFERILSRHYYILHESKRTPQETKEDFNMTFTECVEQDKPICMSPSNLIELVRYFCGQDPVCESKGRANNPTILSRAKTHVTKYFPVVGVIEDAESFFYLLEKRIPSFFDGAVSVYTKIMSKMKVRYRNSQKIMPDDKTRDYVISQMAEAYDFYNFVKQRQHNMLTALGKTES